MQARTTSEQLIYAATQPARSIATLMPELEPEMVQVIDVALTFDMHGRWQTAAAMGHALRSAAGRPCAVPVRSAPASTPASHPISSSAPTLIHGSGDSRDTKKP